MYTFNKAWVLPRYDKTVHITNFVLQYYAYFNTQRAGIATKQQFFFILASKSVLLIVFCECTNLSSSNLGFQTNYLAYIGFLLIGFFATTYKQTILVLQDGL